ncbi:MAG: hypothetical protein ABI811_11355 [Acidobacteriota bacterium]
MMRNRLIGVIAMATLMSTASAQQRAATIGGHPNFNGIWQAISTANWNLEAHSAEALDQFWGLGAIAAIPAGKSVVRGGTIPYLPAALAQRNKNRANWPKEDPEAKCYMLGVPRSVYFGMPFQIFQSAGDWAISQPFAATNRVVYMNDKKELPVESWMGKSYGKWEGNTLVVTTTDQNDKTWFDRAGNFHSDDLKVTERFTLIDKDHIRYEATMEDPRIFSRPWTIEMPLYRIIEDNAQILEHKCVAFADKLLYSDLMHLEQPAKPAAAK